MKKVGAFEAKTHLSQLLNEAEMYKEEILIQNRGKDMAYIVPCSIHDNQKMRKKNENIVEAFKGLREKQEQLRPGEMKELINDGRKR